MNPFVFLLALLILAPLVEIYVLIQVGEVIGALPTIGLIILTAVAGIALLRIQGFSTLQRARRAMAQGQPPALEMLEGVVLLLGAVLLLIPGFVTDILGFLCLIPPIRRTLVLFWLQRFLVRPVPPVQRGSDRGGNIIEGEYRREKD